MPEPLIDRLVRLRPLGDGLSTLRETLELDAAGHDVVHSRTSEDLAFDWAI